jgi:hypothetical protein
VKDRTLNSSRLSSIVYVYISQIINNSMPPLGLHVALGLDVLVQDVRDGGEKIK